MSLMLWLADIAAAGPPNYQALMRGWRRKLSAASKDVIQNAEGYR